VQFTSFPAAQIPYPECAAVYEPVCPRHRHTTTRKARSQTRFQARIPTVLMGETCRPVCARFVLGLIAVRRGDLAQARAQAVAALLVMRDQGVLLRVPLLLDELAIVAGRESQGERAARLLGAAASLRETSGATPDPALRDEVEAMVPVVRAALGEERWAAAFEAGKAMTLEEATANALGERW
jgi:hypothetical protein